jgi:Holliday junction DNA helicase RuvB
MEWSASRGAFVLRPQREAPAVAPVAPRKAPEAGEAAAAGSKAVPGSALRPRSFDEFVGQKRAVESLRLLARAARERGEVPGHVLLAGPGGLGKTTLAGLVAAERGARLHRALAAHLEPQALAPLLARLEDGDVLFVDEIHRLGARAEEAVYSALEDGFVDAMVVDAGAARMRSVRIRLERFTLVGATTSAGALSEPFRGRFALIETLERYDAGDIARIVTGAAERLGKPADAMAARAVAALARGVPREALRLLERARDVAQVSGAESIEASHVDLAAIGLGIDVDGLLKEEREMLDLLLERGKPMGLQAIADALGLDADTLRRVHEPWLLRSGLLERTERGRQATEAARERRSRRRPGGIPRPAPMPRFHILVHEHDHVHLHGHG